MKKTNYAISISHLAIFFVVLTGSISSILALPSQPNKESLKFIFEDPGSSSEASTHVLAEKRTNKLDILSDFRRYRRGWDIANKHY